ncbi:dethiobiotin synthase [Candidatus Nitrosotenuis aquarius]|uniref:dethiobiotin synthase n=1 Tax=Candidatus Nitrosotenuis aquarius TaxID=1846278 RepID=UPI000C1E102B|nr:dethiobiotin synthase [Candidatus Nitrosotenuis aquarius]
MKSIFITGADTGIGKTVFTCALTSTLKSSGVDVGVMKPFATGIPQKNGFKSEDVELLVHHSGVNDPESLINPYFFPIPTSPYRAAKKLGKTIDVDLVLSSYEKLQANHDVVLVEGIGGILVPILRDYFVADLIKDLNLDVLMVTGTKMGSVNHTLLALNLCKKYGINVLGLIINQTDTEGYVMQELEEDLVSLSGIDVICKIPNIQNGNIMTISQILQKDSVLSKL